MFRMLKYRDRDGLDASTGNVDYGSITIDQTKETDYRIGYFSSDETLFLSDHA